MASYTHDSAAQSSTSPSKNRQGVIFTALAGLLWGTSFPAIKIGLSYIDPILFVFLRFFLAGIILLVIVLTQGLNKRYFTNYQIWILGAVNAISFLLQYLGQVSTSASNTALLVNTSAVMVPVASAVFFAEKFSAPKTVGVVLGFMGAILVTSRGSLGYLGSSEIIGDIMVLLSGLAWTAFVLLGKRLLSEAHAQPFQLTSSMILISSIALMPFLGWVQPASFSSLSLLGWLAVFYTIIFNTIIPFFLWSRGLKQVTATISTVVLLIEIVVALFISIAFLSEQLVLASAVGAIMIMAAVVLVSR